MRFVLIGLLLILFASGCSLVPPPTPLPADERARVVAAFRAGLQAQGQCPDAIDVAVTLRVRSLFGSGTVSGYLQALSPSQLKFVGLNPLGQPILILVSDGHDFRSLAVTERKMYEGPVTSDYLRRTVSPDLVSESSFYRLIGRLPPGPLRLTSVSREPRGGYWLEVDRAEGGGWSRLLFDPDRLVIRRHVFLDADGQPEAELLYDDFRAGPCPLPQQITVTTSRRNGTFQMRLSDWVDDPGLVAADFTVPVPAGFEKVILK